MKDCGACPLADAKIQRAGLIWIGEQFYKSPEDFMREADILGISRRIKSVPHGFELGKTWVAVAHMRAIPDVETKKARPGIFRLFRPQAIEYVVKGNETKDELDKLEKTRHHACQRDQRGHKRNVCSA